MKKRIIFGLIVGIAICISLEAQKAGDKILFAGFGLGATVSDFEYVVGSDVGYYMFGNSTLFNNAEESTDGGLAYNIGVMYDYFVFDRFSVTFGLSYDSNPVSYKYPKRTAANDLEIDIKFAFITIPVGVHYYFFDHLLVGGGMYLGIPVRDDFEMKYGSAKASDELTTNNDFGMFFDLGYNFDITEQHNILLSMRYKHGFSKVYSDDDMITNIKLSTLYILQLAYGYKFK
jgi:hypothetical protein